MRAAWLFLCAMCLALPARDARAFDLRWASGETDLRFEEVRACTLYLCISGAGEVLPQEWRLAYALEGAERIRFGTDFSGTGTVGLCRSAMEGTSADVAARKQILQHCSIHSTGRARCARYVLELPGRARATIRALVVPRPDELQREALEVTTNGGATGACPPIVAAMTTRTDDGALVVEASGDGLDRVATIRLVNGDGRVLGVMTITSRSSTTITSTLSRAALVPGGRVEFVDALGRLDAVRVPSVEPDVGPLGAQDRLVIQFLRGEVEPAPGTSGGAVLQHRFARPWLRDSLVACDVVRLNRLFPAFRREDVHSRNLIGEGVLLDDLSDIYVATVAPGTDQLAASIRLEDLPGVMSAGADPLLPVAHQAPTNDPLWGLQWGLRNVGQNVCSFLAAFDRDINPEGAWARTHGAGASIAIIDAGLRYPNSPHFDLARAVSDTSLLPVDETWSDSTTSAHGNAVASLAMADWNNGDCIAGVAEDATTWAIKALDRYGNSIPSLVAGAIDYGRRRNRGTMNLSLGFEEGTITPAAKGAIARACLDAFYTGHLIVASMGNSFDSTKKNYPAAFSKRVCAVGATDVYGHRWRDLTYGGSDLVESSYGSWTDLVAPGGRFTMTAYDPGPIQHCHDLSNCLLGDGASHFGGTSAAAPLVTGIAALLQSYNLGLGRPPLLGEDIQQIMVRNVHDVTEPLPAGSGFDVATGYGIPQAGAALDFIAPPRYVRQRSVGFEGTSGTLAFQDSALNNVQITLLNEPNGLLPVPRLATRVRMGGSGLFGAGYQGPPTLWVRSSGTLAWDSLSTFDYNQDVNWGRVRMGTIVPTGAEFEAFVYRIGGTPQLWFPCPPESARVAYTTIGVVDTLAVAVEEYPRSPIELKLGPNPASGAVSISFWLPHRARVNLEILDIAGRVVATIVDRELEGGTHRLKWDGTSARVGPAAPGVYLCRLRISGRQEVRKFAAIAWHGQ